MDDVLDALFFGPPVLMACNSLFATATMLGLTRDLPQIETERDMLKFKQFVAVQMYQALFQMAMIAIPVLAAVWAWYGAGWPGRTAVLYLLPAVGVSVLTSPLKLLETRIKKMPVAEPFCEEFDHVVEVWMKKPLPDW